MVCLGFGSKWSRVTVTFKTVPMFFILKFGDSSPSDCMLDKLGINLVTFY